MKQTPLNLKQTLTEQERQDLTDTAKSLREDLLQDGIEMSHRFRGIKLYLHIKGPTFEHLNQIVKPIIKEYFPRNHMTSGGGHEFTFRANPR